VTIRHTWSKTSQIFQFFNHKRPTDVCNRPDTHADGGCLSVYRQAPHSKMREKTLCALCMIFSLYTHSAGAEWRRRQVSNRTTTRAGPLSKKGGHKCPVVRRRTIDIPQHYRARSRFACQSAGQQSAEGTPRGVGSATLTSRQGSGRQPDTALALGVQIEFINEQARRMEARTRGRPRRSPNRRIFVLLCVPRTPSRLRPLPPKPPHLRSPSPMSVIVQ
jgi:hypothetical protein